MRFRQPFGQPPGKAYRDRTGNVVHHEVRESDVLHPAALVHLQLDAAVKGVVDRAVRHSDILKGTAAVALARAVGTGTLVEGMAGFAAVAGHDFSPFMRFRGGKGVATSLGVILIYTPIAGILTVIIWLVTVLTMRYSSMGALVSFSLMPVWVLLQGYPSEKLYIAIIISVLLVAKHSGNIKRLIKGTEGKIGNRGNK